MNDQPGRHCAGRRDGDRLASNEGAVLQNPRVTFLLYDKLLLPATTATAAARAATSASSAAASPAALAGSSCFLFGSWSSRRATRKLDELGHASAVSKVDVGGVHDGVHRLFAQIAENAADDAACSTCFAHDVP